MEIKTIQKFLANDGSEHNSKEAAIAHNLRGPRVEAIEKAFDESKLDTKLVTEDERGNKVLYDDDLPAFLADNADLLATLLAKPVTPRPRKANDETKA